MAHLHVSDLAYAHPGGELLFHDVSFRLPAGRHAGMVGVNGVGKTTLLRVLAGELEADAGDANIGGRVLYMPQNAGTGGGTVRELLLAVAPARVRAAGEAMLAAERALAQGDDDHAGVALGEAIGEWSALGGYELEGQWDAACRRIVRSGLSEIGDREAVTLSGGERKRLLLDLLFASEANVLLLDEPDNFLDVPAKRELERQVRATKKTILLISHDRELLTAACDAIVTLEGNGAWVHGESYATYAAAREHRQKLMGDRVERWKEEERRLRELVRLFKERAKYAPVWAKKADAMETRWKRWVDEGPPPAPVVDHTIKVRLRGGDSARRVVALKDVAIDGLVRPFSEEVHFGERIGLVGPNGSGKTHLIRLLAGEAVGHDGDVVLGPRVSPGLFTQLNARADFSGRKVHRHRARARRRAGPRDAGPGPLRPGRGGAALLRDAQRRSARAAGDPLPRARGPQPAAPRRAHRQPRHRVLRGARDGPGRLRGHGRRRLARPRLPAHARPLLPARPRRRRRAAGRPRRGAGRPRRLTAGRTSFVWVHGPA